MPRTATPPRLELPEAVPGTAEQLIEIAHEIIGSRPSGRARGDKAQLQRVVDQLGHLGRGLLGELQQQLTAPPAKKLAAQLAKIEKRALALDNALAELPTFSSELVTTVYHAQRNWNPTTRTFHKAGLGTAPPRRAVQAIHSAAQQQGRGWQEGSVLGTAPPTQPGPMRSYQRIVGDPRTFTANQVAQLVIAERGAKAASAEEHRPVYAAVALLWNWATGLPDEGAHLRKHVRHGVRLALVQAERAAVEQAIHKESGRYQAPLTESLDFPARRKHQARMAHLQAELERLQQEEVKIMKSFAQRPADISAK